MAERIQYETRNTRHETRKILGYDPLFDIQDHRVLASQRDSLTPEEFERRKTQLETRTRHNLETALGERFNVEISQVIFDIIDGHLQSPEHDEPFIQVVKRGQKYRQKNGSTETERERAEVEGFEKIQEILTNPQFEGAKIIVISPRGKENSDYQHNFFDIWEKHGDRIIMCRYTSCATYEQFRQVAESLDPPSELTQNPLDSDFLKTPLVTYKSIDEILDLFPPDEGVITREDMEKIILFCNQVILDYINNPSLLTFNALLNLADRKSSTPTGSDLNSDHLLKPYAIAQIINYFGNLPVRQVLAGCGVQSNSTISNFKFQISNFMHYSVADFAFPHQIKSSEDTSDFPCPRCGYIITYGAGIKKCPGCDLEATCS